jgi:hypothetical protein
MADTIRIRRGTTSAWNAANPVLALGEQGYDTTTKQMKVGDGSTAWNALAYLDISATNLTTGTLPDARLSAKVKSLADLATPASTQLLAMNSSGAVVDGSSVVVALGLKPLPVNSITVLGVTAAAVAPSGTSANLVIIGDQSVDSGATALTDSVFVGTQSGKIAKAGNGNVALGNLTLSQIENTSHNTTVGDASLRQLKDGSDSNSSHGYVAGTDLWLGSWNVFDGSYAGAYSRYGSYNLLRGGYAGAHSVASRTYNGTHNIGDGYQVMLECEGHRNQASGFESLFGCKGDDNLAFGDESGKVITQVSLATDLVISSVGSQTSFTVTGGPVASHSNIRVVVKDASDTNRPYWGRGSYNHTTGIVTVTEAFPITVVSSDTISLSSIPRQNIFIGLRSGSGAGVQKADAFNTICIGADTNSLQDNSIRIGNASVTRAEIIGDLHCGSINITSNWINTPGPTNGAIWRSGGHLYLTSDTSSITFLSSNNGLFTLRLYNDGRLCQQVPTSATPDDNGEVCFERTSNTTLTIKMRGSDGTVRLTALTLS